MLWKWHRREPRGRRIVSMLPHLTDATSPTIFLSRVAVETAMGFAEATGEPDDHLWAVEIQETIIALQNGREPSSEPVDGSEEQAQRRGYRWEESIGEWVARTPAAKTSAAPTVLVKGRASMAADPTPCFPCSTDSSSPETDPFEAPASSVTSSPSSVGTKRSFGWLDSSPLQPVKRRRSARMVVIENNPGRRRCASRSASTGPKSPALEPHPSERRILRHHRRPTRASSAANQAASRVEVVVINKKETYTREESAPAPAEPVEKQVHRAVERRRPGRPRVSSVPNPAMRAAIPCSEDDSDDELSFM